MTRREKFKTSRTKAATDENRVFLLKVKTCNHPVSKHLKNINSPASFPLLFISSGWMRIGRHGDGGFTSGLRIPPPAEFGSVPRCSDASAVLLLLVYGTEMIIRLIDRSMENDFADVFTVS